jgi:hypothetical protein
MSSDGDRLAQARQWMREGRHDEALDWLAGWCRRAEDGEAEQLLAQCRYAAYQQHPPRGAGRPLPAAPAPDPFAAVEGIPEISVGQLDARSVAAGIMRHGAVLVRGLLSSHLAMELATDVRRAIDACAAWHARGETGDDPWYARLSLADDCPLAQARTWVEGGGGVWLADSPRMLFKLTELFVASGIVDMVGEYFGERPMLSVGKSTLRCVPASIRHADWHQDGAFMGAGIRSLNVWLALSHCGEDASGLECLPRRLPAVLPTGSHGAYFDWSVGPGMVEQAAGGTATVSPVFAPGDALLFDHFFLHRTGVPAAIARDRYAIESWFFAPTSYPADQVPLKI